MPELAEVDYFRRKWAEAARRVPVSRVAAHAGSRALRGVRSADLRRALVGRRLTSSAAGGKQMLFRFGPRAWLGVHLGMTGELRAEPADFRPGRHDHLVLYAKGRALVYSDPRQFGRVRLHLGEDAPEWWSGIAPGPLSPRFTLAAVGEFLRRRGRAPIKAVLLMQERFPGIGNWMADEILWRAGIHPRRPAGSLRPGEIRALWRECRRVCRLALKVVGRNGPNSAVPSSWLLPHRWEDGGHCPRTGAALRREVIGGRMTCWSPGRQKP